MAAKQVASEEAQKVGTATPPPADQPAVAVSVGVNMLPATPLVPATSLVPTEKSFKRFHGRIRLDAMKVGSQASKVDEEVLQHLKGQLGVKVEVCLEITATSEKGIRGKVAAIVKENAKTMKFEFCEFEEE
jgi:hypothetical protein